MSDTQKPISGTKIKSAMEMALERLEKRKAVDPENMARFELLPKGRALAGKFMSDKNFNLAAELKNIAKKDLNIIVEGIQEIFLSNMHLPSSDIIITANRKAMEGLSQIKNNKKQLSGILKDMETMFHHYQSTVQQAGEAFQQQIQMEQEKTPQPPTMGNYDPQGQNQQQNYQQRWAMIVNQIEKRYNEAFSKMKEAIRSLD